jgi:hypothetical protein
MYELINGEEMHALHPATFEIPSWFDRYGASIGDMVKIGVRADGSGERFWVAIIAIADNKFIGVIRNNLVNTDTHGLSYGDEVRFGPEHIIGVNPVDVSHGDEEPKSNHVYHHIAANDPNMH